MAAPCMKNGFMLISRKAWSSTVKSLETWRKTQSNVCRCLCSASSQGSAAPPSQGSSYDGSLVERFKQAVSGSPRAIPTRHTLCRTSETDPSKHGDAHLGLFYTIPEEHMSRWLRGCFRPDYLKVIKAFNECALMVRPPAVEVINYLKKADYSMPVVRYIFYGRNGGGKSLSMAHVIHFAGTHGWLILHVPWATHWNRFSREIQSSLYKDGRFDLPVEAGIWLANFLKMNEPILKELNPKTNGRYVWSRREVTEVGTPWTEVIDFGLGRLKYASDIVGMLLKEIREQASQQKFRTLVAIDGVNCFWQNTRLKRPEDRTIIHSSELTLIHNFKKMLRNDWSGGAIVMTVDCKATERSDGESDQPRYLLGKEGFEWLDPHLPVQVPDYSDKEVLSCLEYFEDRHWIQNPKCRTDEGRKEFIFLSSKNPYELYRVTAPY